MEKNRATLYNGRWYGEDISDYGKEQGYIDYKCLSRIVGNMILNNNLIRYEFDYWELENGLDYDEENDEYIDIFQYYIITDNGAEFLKEHTDEIVYYNENLDCYLWGITHFGTMWSGVLTDIKIAEEEQ